ncbi:hypothetical protein [Thalassotalea sp. PLHSN55]|uniref:hypothetical protein n=1 Tax=Thalassotalea sp. PLHSN55 TaxID=3435888 RepID=UPI003F874062
MKNSPNSQLDDDHAIAENTQHTPLAKMPAGQQHILKNMQRTWKDFIPHYLIVLTIVFTYGYFYEQSQTADTNDKHSAVSIAPTHINNNFYAWSFQTSSIYFAPNNSHYFLPTLHHLNRKQPLFTSMLSLQPTTDE